MLVAFLVGLIIGVLGTLAVEYGFKVLADNGETVEQSFCSHGVPWDECPDCSH